MKLSGLFKEDYQKLPVHPTILDLPFELPNFRWQLDFKTPMHSYTRGKGSETVREISMPSINSILPELKRVGISKLMPDKFAMWQSYDDNTPEFKSVEKQLFPNLVDEPSFHTDDMFGGDVGSITIVMSHLNMAVTLIHGIYVGRDGKEYTVYFNDAITGKLNKLFDETLNRINSTNAPQ